jgi:hypothetical protein
VPQKLVPSIRYKGEFRLDTAAGKLAFKGEVSKFPSVEAFAVYNGGPPVVIFQEPATGAVDDIASLRPVEKEIQLPIYEGSWKSTDPTARFTLDIKGEDFVFTERSAFIEQVTPLSPEPSVLSFKRSGSKLEATWSGLLVTKDMQGKFKEMKQPGKGPVKPYEFVR